MPTEPIKLVAFDMEGCLTDDPTVWELMHCRLGTWESHGRPYWDRYRAGEFGYDEFARMDVAVWQGAPARALREAAAEVALMPGCEELLERLARVGMEVAIISNGLRCVARRFEAEFGVRWVHANRAVARDGRLTGELSLEVPFASKGDVLRGLARSRGLRPEQVAAVGDGRADVAMFRVAGTGIAFRPTHPEVAEAASHVVREPELRGVGEVLLRRCGARGG